jgi:hypothetical protein
MKPRTLLVLGLLASAGCASRANLTDSHGRASRAAFATQVANPGAGARPHKQPGLSAREAQIVTKNYERAHIARGVTAAEDQGMVIVAPTERSGQQPYMPPPSVPQERR